MLTESSEPAETREVVDTVFTLLVKEDLVSFSSKLAWTRDIFFHQVGPDVWREMIQNEAFEEKSFILVNPVGQRQQGQHLPSTWRASRQRPK